MTDMTGKRVLITGANGGIGLAAAKELAAKGAEVIIACRDSAKTTEALKAIGEVASVRPVNLPVDLANLQSVRDLAASFQEKYDALDVLINNAGVMPNKQQITEDGFELQMAVNHLSHFLLTNLLLDNLKAAASARVISVSSDQHKKSEMDLSTFRGFEKYNMGKAYNQSKLGTVMFAMELAKRLEGTGVTSNVLHPGVVSTDIMRDMPKLMTKIIGLMLASPEKGARTTLMLATDKGLETVTGKYYSQGKLGDYSKLADDASTRAEFWAASEQAVGL